MTPLELIRYEIGRGDIDLTDKINDFGLDSLEFVDLIQSIEGARSIALDPTAVATAVTVGDLVKAIERGLADAD